MKIAVTLPQNITANCILLPSFKRERLHLQNNHYISKESDLANLNQPVNLPCKIYFELLNANTNDTTLRIRKRDPIGFFMPINKGTEQVETKWEAVNKGN